jgi:hypothetical protein
MIALNKFIRSINISTEIEEIFATTITEIAVSNDLNVSKHISFDMAISEFSYISDIFVEYDGNTYSILGHKEIKNTFSINCFILENDLATLHFEINDIPSESSLVIKIKTHELLEKMWGRYEYAIPLTISDPNKRDSLSEGLRCNLNFRVNVKSNYDIKNINCQNFNHRCESLSENNKTLFSSKPQSINKAQYLIINYEINEKPMSVLYNSLYNGENYFLLGHSFTNANKNHPSLNEFFFLLDFSEDISREQLKLQIDTISKLLKAIYTTDKFNLLIFSSKYYLFSDNSLFSTSLNIKEALNFVNSFSLHGSMDAEKMFEYATQAHVPLAYRRNFVFLSSSNIKYDKNIADNIGNTIQSSRVFILLIDAHLNRYFASCIADQRQGSYFTINNTDDIELVTCNFYKHISAETISEINIDFGNIEISKISENPYIAIPTFKTIYIAGKSQEHIYESPIIRTIIGSEVIDTECKEIIELKNGDFLQRYLNTNGFVKTRSEQTQSSYQSSKIATIGKKENKYFFDDMEDQSDELETINFQKKEDVEISLFTSKEYLGNIADDDQKNMIEAINQLIVQGMPEEGIIYFELIDNEENKPDITNFAIFFNQIEYNEELVDIAKERMQSIIKNINWTETNRSEKITCIIEYLVKRI